MMYRKQDLKNTFRAFIPIMNNSWRTNIATILVLKFFGVSNSRLDIINQIQQLDSMGMEQGWAPGFPVQPEYPQIPGGFFRFFRQNYRAVSVEKLFPGSTGNFAGG